MNRAVSFSPPFFEIVGAVVASYLGQALGWYAPGELADSIGAVVGAIVVLFIWGVISRQRTA